MTSPTPDLLKPLKIEKWVPSQANRLTPTLIFPCGNWDGLDELKQKVTQRSGLDLAETIIHWASPLDPSAPVHRKQIEAELEPLLSYDYWQQMANHDYVDLPDMQHRMKLQLLVICHLENMPQDSLAEWLNKLASTIRSIKLNERVDYSLSLLVLGNPAMDLEKLQGYWPRFYIGKMTWSGTQVTPQHASQVCQNIVINWATTELPRFIEHVIDTRQKSVCWISMGASAILVDLQAASDRFAPEVLSQFTGRLVAPSPNDAQRDLLDNAAEEKRRELQGNLLIQAARTAKQIGWDITVKEYQPSPDLKWPQQRYPEAEVVWDKLKRQGCYLAFESKVAKTLFGDATPWWLYEGDDTLFLSPSWSFFQKSWKQLKFGWKRFKGSFRHIPLPNPAGLEALLAENYQSLENGLRRETKQVADQGYQDLLDTFAFLVERRGYTGEHLPLDSSVEWPSGLRAVDHILGAIVERLEHSAIFLFSGKPVQPAPLVSNDYWLAAAASDVATIEDGVRRCARMRRSLFTPWGILIKLLVAWPLMAGLLNLFLSQWSMITLALISAGLLVLLGLIEFIIWGVKQDLLLRQVRAQINARFADRVLTLIARIIQDHSLNIAARLPPLKNVLSELSTALEEENKRVLHECALVAKQVGNYEDGLLYWLMDYEQVLGTRTITVPGDSDWPALTGETASVWDDARDARTKLSWKSEAKRHANAEASQKSDGKFEKVEIAFIVDHAMPLLRKPKLAPMVIQELRELSKTYATADFKAEQMSTAVLAEKLESLNAGKKWRWLYQRAQPLGGEIKRPYSILTTISVPDETPLTGANGKISEYWPKDAQVLFSHQIHEIGCMRAVVEWT